MWNLIISIIALYVLIVHILPRLILTHYGFKKSKLPKKIPKDMLKAINSIKRKSKNKTQYLKNSYNFITKKYRGERLNMLWRPDLLMTKDIDKVWAHSGYLPCTWQSYLLRIFLIKGGFKESEIKQNFRFCNFITHTYLEVKTNPKWVVADTFARNLGIPFGKRLPYFK